MPEESLGKKKSDIIQQKVVFFMQILCEIKKSMYFCNGFTKRIDKKTP